MKTFFEKLYKKNKTSFLEDLFENIEKTQKMFIVTANPEAFMLGIEDSSFRQLLCDSETTLVADGIGLIKGAKMLNIDIPERIPGIELTQSLLDYGNKHKKSVYLFGAEASVLKALCQKLKTDFPNLRIAGAANGYIPDKDSVFEDIRFKSPDIILVALGMPLQEKLIYKHYKNFDKGIFVGVGGSFDVLSGTKKRAPHFFINNNLEWLYRIIKEPKRLKRFYTRNVKFLFKLKREK